MLIELPSAHFSLLLPATPVLMLRAAAAKTTADCPIPCGDTCCTDSACHSLGDLHWCGLIPFPPSNAQAAQPPSADAGRKVLSMEEPAKTKITADCPIPCGDTCCTDSACHSLGDLHWCGLIPFPPSNAQAAQPPSADAGRKVLSMEEPAKTKITADCPIPCGDTCCTDSACHSLGDLHWCGLIPFPPSNAQAAQPPSPALGRKMLSQ